MRLKKLLALVLSFAMLLSTTGLTAFATEADYVAKIGETEYADFDSAITSANEMTGDVTVEIYALVEYTDSTANLTGTYDSINFVGMNSDAGISITRNGSNGYISGGGNDCAVTFTGLTLSKPEGGYADDAGFMNVAFSVYRVGSVAYTDCTFPNGACAAGCPTTYTGCEFGTSHDKYGLWAYGTETTVTDSEFVGTRAIKMYAEGSAKTTDLTVSGSDFSRTTGGKPDIILSLGESITLSDNTYSGNGVLRLETTSAGTVVTSDDVITCIDDATGNACGVLVDGKIYTTVTEAAEVAEAGDTVTLLYDTEEEVVFAEGVTVDTNNYNAPNVSVEGEDSGETETVVAQVGDVECASLAEAFAKAVDGDTVTLLADVAIDTETYTIADGISLTLNMNGKKITVTDNATGNYELFYIYGELTVIGDGTIELTSTNNREWNAMSAIFHNRGGVLTIENGTFKNLGGTDMAWVVDNSGNWYGNATTNIEGGTLTSTYTAIRNRMEQNSHGASGTAILNISGGYIDGTTSAVWAQAASVSETAPATGEINVTGGEIGLINTARSAGAECMTTISGGTVAGFKGEVGELTVTDDGEITGTVTILTADGEEANYIVDENGVYIEAPAGPVEVVSTEELQAALDAATDGTTIQLKSNTTYGVVYVGRPTKSNDTTMYCETHDFTTSNAEEFKAHLAETGYHTTPRYTTNLTNVTIIGAEGATVAGAVATSGHSYGDVYDYVLDKDYDVGSAYYNTLYITNLTFSGVNFVGKVDINTSDADSVYDGVTFDNCTFTTGGTASTNGAAIRYYNEANNGNVKNITVDDCTFTNCYQGVYVHHVNDVTVTDSTFDTTGHNAIALQSHNGAVDFGDVVISGNTFKNIADRIIRFGDVGEGSDITITNNNATNSGDENGEFIKATSIANGGTINRTSNTWNGYDDEELVYENGTLSVPTATLEGSGTAADPYLIEDIDDLKWFRDDVNAGNTYTNQYVKLTSDIDLTSVENWEPIGNSTNKFLGHFDGGNNTISNLKINNTNSYVGFFGYTSGGSLKNLTLNNVDIDARLGVGALVGCPFTSDIDNIKLTGKVTIDAAFYVGGVAGRNAYGDLTNITVDVTSESYVKATSTEDGTAYRTYVGGVVGFLGEGNGVVKNVTSNIKVIGDVCDIGGIAGIAHYGNTFENVTFSGTVEAPADATEVGGIAGVWHNQAGQTVTFTNVTVSEDASVEVGGLDVTETQGLVGGAYNPENETADTSGSLVVDGKDVWLKVAAIGETKYATLADAIAAAQDGDTIELLACTIDEYVAPWAADSTHASEKSITIVGAENFGSILTGGLYLGYDDSGCREHTITIKGIAFEGKGILVAGQKNVVIEGNKFSNITDYVATSQSATQNAISVIGKNINATITNNVINTAASCGIHLRDVASATVTGNTVSNTTYNSITINPTAGSNGAFVVTDNTLSNWGLSGTEGRALRLSGGASLTFNGNVMTNDNAPEQFVKTTGTAEVDASKNYWNGVTPMTDGIFSTDIAADPAPILKSYYTDTDKTNLVNIPIPVAKIGDVEYSTLADAIAAVQDGDTIQLLAGAVIEEGEINLPTLNNVTIKGAEGAVLKNTNLACRRNAVSLTGFTIDGVVFDSSKIIVVAWTDTCEFKDWTITNCTFKNLTAENNEAALHLNVGVNVALENLTFTNNTLDNLTGGSKSGIYGQYTGKIVIENNTFNNIAFRPYIVQLTSDDGVADELIVTGNTFSGSAKGRAQALTNNAEGTDAVKLVVNDNIFKGITESQQICYWNFNAETTTADFNNNYYDIDVLSNPNRFYFNAAASDASDLVEYGIFPLYTELNEDGSIDTDSLTEAPAIMVTYPVGNPVYPEGKIEYYNDMREAVPHSTNVPRLEGATITLLKDMSGLGMRFMENGMVFDLNGHTYTLTGGTGSTGTETSGFQIRPEVTETATIKNGTVKLAEGVNICWMFNSYATNFVVEDATVDCTNLNYNSYGTSCYVVVSRAEDNIQFAGSTTITGFNSTVAGPAINVGGTMDIGEDVVLNDATFELDGGATLTAPAGLNVVTANGYRVVYENGVYTSVSIPYVAQIGETKFETLVEALAAAQDDETVTLLADVELDAPITIKKSITIDGNGKTIAQSDACNNNIALLYFEGAANNVLNVTVKNATFDGLKTGAAIRTLYVNMTIDNCVFQNCEHTVGQGLVRLTYGSATIKNSKFLNNNCSMGVSFNWDAEEAQTVNDTLTIDNCEFTGNTANKTALVYYVKGIGCEIKNSEFNNNKVNCTDNGATIYLGFQDNCKVTNNLFQNNVVTESGTSTRVAGTVFAGYQATITDNVIVNNTASNGNSDTLGQVCISTYYEDGYVNLNSNYWGGNAPVYGVDYTIQHQTGAADYGMEDYYAEYTTDVNGNLELSDKKEITYVATVGTRKFTSLAEAINAAQAGDTVTLIADVALDETITISGKAVTLDLNGKTITGTDNNTTGNFYLIDNRGTLTVKDSVGDGKITLTAVNNREWNNSSVVIATNPGGKLIVESGTIEHLGGTDMAYALDNLTNGKGTYAETVINGGTIKSTYRAVRQFLNGIEAQNILTINGGTVEGTNKSIFFHDPSAKANTGALTVSENAVIKGDVYLFVTEGSTEWPVEVSIAAAALADGSTVTSKNVPDGYEVKNDNGTWGVVTVELKEFYGTNLTLGNELDINFAFSTEHVENTGYAEIVRSYADDRADETITVQLSDCAISGSYYVIKYAGMAAKEMCDEIKVTVYDADGEQVSVTRTDSIRDYILRNVDKDNLATTSTRTVEETRTLLIDMLNYGAAAQTNFEYNTDDLANSTLTDAQKAYGTQTTPTCENTRSVTYANTDKVAYLGTQFVLESKISMRIAILTSEITGGTADISFVDHYDVEQKVTINAAECETDGSYTLFKIDEIVVADGRCDVTCVFKNADGEEVVTVVDSMESYVARNGASYPWLYEIMKFSDAAYASFH